MADKKFKGCPFGTQTARFDVSGVHPKSKMPGTFTQTPYCRKATSTLSKKLGPGSYNVETGSFNAQAVEERADGPGWARAYEVARMAALPHLLHKEQWELKRLLKRKLGPGSYEIKDFLESSDEKPRSMRGICQTKDKRFKEPVTMSNVTPGPGTYGDGGIPHSAIEVKDKKSISTIGLLDAGSSFPRSLPTVGSDLGPGSYQFDSFTDVLHKKLTSVRGPYDLFSGDRNKPIKTGHLAAPQNANLGPGQYEIKSFNEELVNEHKKKQGKFGKVAQYPTSNSERIFSHTLSQCPKEATFPGPGQYDPKAQTKPLMQAKFSPGFLSSAQRNDRLSQKFFTRNFNPVGAGRYDIQKWEEAQHKNGHDSIFRSKTAKPNATMEKFLKERIRGKDIRPKDKVYIVEPGAPNKYSYSYNDTPQFAAQRAATIA
ncbi:unnamed protein product [Owenia fusiformis]|uniref:Uncharacterized protein n=1 Tax=Owenia fusiformis TaxID=6347 RepID=A0A8J1USQ9_OWEFU|nr:unnamed protein product [Owenia fusiformis]